MNDRDDLERTLESMGSAPVPAPDEAFVRALEVQLSAADAGSNVSPLVRRTRRVGVVSIAAASLAFAGVAAAASVAITHPFRDDPPAVTSTAVPSTSAEPSTTTTVAPSSTPVPTDAPVTVPSTLPTTAPATEPPTLPPTVPPTVAPTVPPTMAPTTVPPTVATTLPPATTTTEVRTPATISLTCGVVDATKVRCSWSAGPDGTAKYEVLRSSPSSTTGRAYEVGVDAGNTWLDPEAAVGATGRYVVWAVDASGKGIAHSTLVTVDCC